MALLAVGQLSVVIEVDPHVLAQRQAGLYADQRRVTVEKQDGSRQTLDMNRLADRHVRHGWVRTIHSSQGATCDHVIAHLESFRANTVDAASVYVAISRARKGAGIYTDSRAKLTEALGLRDGAQVGAIDDILAEEHAAHSAFRPFEAGIS